MTRKELETLLAEWKSRLHLDAWDFRVKWESKWAQAGDAIASVEIESMYDQAWITFDTKVLTKSNADAEKTVIHELLHVLDRDRTVILAEIEPSLHPDTFRLFSRVEYLQTEAVIDRLATIIYELTRVETSRTS